MPVYEVRLWPRGSFEFQPRADTLFGAICWAVRTLWGEEKLLQLLEEFLSSPPFLLTGAFPCQIGSGGKINYYLPRPLLAPLSWAELSDFQKEALNHLKGFHPYHSPGQVPLTWLSDQYKSFKKVEFISSDAFAHNVLKKSASEKPLFQSYLQGLLRMPAWRVQCGRAKILADRLCQSTGGAGQLFFQEEHFLSRGWGYYVLIRTSHWEDLLLPVWRYLEDSGLGRNARTGRNHFRLEWAADPPWLPQGTGPRFVNLSHYCQAPKDKIDWSASYYEVQAYRGAVESRAEFAGAPVWKRRLLLIREGSCLQAEEKQSHFGALVPTARVSGKTIYHYALAWPLYLDAPEEG